MAYRKGHIRTGMFGVVLSVIAFLSFTVELSHVFLDHHRSWVAIAAMAMLALALIACLAQRDSIAHDAKAALT